MLNRVQRGAATRATRWARTAVVAVVALGVVSCGSHDARKAQTITLPTTINSVRLDAPPVGTRPALSEEDARATLNQGDDLAGASRVDSVLALVTSTTTDHVLAWVFVGYDVPFIGKGPNGPTGKATIVEPVGVSERRPLFTELAQTS